MMNRTIKFDAYVKDALLCLLNNYARKTPEEFQFGLSPQSALSLAESFAELYERVLQVRHPLLEARRKAER